MGRPRNGHIYSIYKGVKKMFRQVFRKSTDSTLNISYSKLNNLYTQKRMVCFWNTISKRKKTTVNSSMSSSVLAEYYQSIMHDTGVLTPAQLDIHTIMCLLCIIHMNIL